MKKPKNLPIKIIQKRTSIDDSLTEGSRGDDPRWMDNVPLEERSEMVVKTLKAVNEELERRLKNNNYIPAAIELKLDTRTTSKSHRSYIRDITDVNRKKNIIGFYDTSSLLVKIENLRDIQSIERNALNHNKNKHGLASIVEANLFHPKIDIQNKEILKVKLIDFQENQLNTIVHREFQKRCKEQNIKIVGSHYSAEILVYQVDFDEKAVAVLQSFEGLSSIEDMPTYSVVFDSGDEEKVAFKDFRIPEKGKFYPTIGVLDSGIAKCESLSPWLLPDKHISYIEDELDAGHGTAVASVILYGDTLEGKNYTNSDGCFLYDATIVPKRGLLQTVTEFDLIDNIRQAIKTKPNIKIWNLCVGWSVEADSHSISDFGAALDSIQDEFNVIICTSTGNCDNFKINKPKRKIQRSADSVRSLTVGSIAHTKSIYDISEENEPSPFSRTGSGPFGIVKPELTHYGGNAGVDERGERVISGVGVLDKSNNLGFQAGTSFSTPRVTSILASLENQLAEDFDPLLLKSLTIHSASYPSVILDSEERLKQMGFGLPKGINDILYNDENEITLVIRDTLEKGNFIEILDFPFPEDLIEGNFYTGEITATLVSMPELKASQGEEYCQSNIDVSMGTYNEKVPREGKTIRNDIGKDRDAKNLLQPSIYSKREITKNKSFNSERILKTFYQKFQPVKKWAINLDDLSETSKIKYLEYPKRWFLKIEGLYRDFLENSQDNLNTDFCLIITIRDSKRKTPVYETVSAGLEANNFVQNTIKIKTEVQLKS